MVSPQLKTLMVFCVMRIKAGRMGGFTPRTVSVGIWRGSITVRVALQPKTPDEEIFGKMKRIAKKLGAKVIGDGGEEC
jgi:hypothetical protein